MMRPKTDDVRLIFMHGVTDTSFEIVSHLIALTRTHIYNHLNHEHWIGVRSGATYGLIYSLYEKPDDEIGGSKKIGATCNDVYRDLKLGDIAIVSFNTGEVERLNVADMNVMEKIVFRMFFPEASMTEDKLVLAQSIVKNFRENYETCNKLVKRGFFTEDDLSNNRIVNVMQKVYSRGVEAAMTKYVKSHKGDIHVRGTVAASVSDANELTPFVLTSYLEEKGVRAIFAPVRAGDEKWRLLKPLTRPYYIDYDPFDDTDEDCHFGTFVAIACTQEGIGHFDKYGQFYVLEQDIDLACKIVKKVCEGKYIFKLVNNGDDILIKDNDSIVVNTNHFLTIEKNEEEKENVGVHNPD